MKLSVVILAKTKSEEQFKMTSNCIESLIKSESDLRIEIIIVESNKDYSSSEFKYPPHVKVVVPEVDFNFNKFLNIGIKIATGEFIALCNNDLIFHETWFTEIYKVSKKNSKILSFSPGNFFKNDLKFELGYKVRTHIMGWCIVTKKELFNRIGFLDETFDFNYADNDYAMTLKISNIRHALVFASCVEHLTADKKSKESTLHLSYNLMIKKAKLETELIPSYIYTKNYEYLLQDKKGLVDNIKFHNKWGEPSVLYRKNKITDFTMNLNLGIFNKFIFKILDLF